MTFESVADYPDVPDDATLWRYLDLYRYLDLLQSSELHLARADQMEDPWEGAFGPMNVEMRPLVYGEHWQQMEPHFPQIYHYSRTHTYLNCWYVGDCESAAMWSLYAGSGKGIAVKTTGSRLKAALTGPGTVTGARVQYIDYSKTWVPEGNLFSALMYKRASFDHEREYRLIKGWFPEVLETDEHNTATKTEPDIPPLALREPVVLPVLIEAVHVSPGLPDWAERVVRDATAKYAPELDVRQSSLGVGPVY